MTGDSNLRGQWRDVRAALLLMGDSGLRREEAAEAQRGKLRVSIYGTLERPVWELTVIGKRNKERTGPVSVATLEALKARWADRGRDFIAELLKTVYVAYDLLDPSQAATQAGYVTRAETAIKTLVKQAAATGEWRLAEE